MISPSSKRHRILSILSRGPASIDHLHPEVAPTMRRGKFALVLRSLVDAGMTVRTFNLYQLTGLGTEVLDDLDAGHAWHTAKPSVRVFGLPSSQSSIFGDEAA